MTASYSIRSVSRITGLSPERIRSWESRYAVVTPERSSNGRRSYSERDMSRLQLLADAIRMGQSISEIADLTEDALRKLVEAGSDTAIQPDTATLVTRIIDDLTVLNIQGCDAALSAAMINLEPWQAVETVIKPLLHRVGDLWQSGTINVGQEHLISSLVRQRLDSALQLMPRPSHRPLILFTTLGGEHHELGAIAACYLARAEGARSDYMGADMPVQDVLDMTAGLAAAALGFSVTIPPSENDTMKNLAEICEKMPDTVKIWLGGTYAHAIGTALRSDRCVVIDSAAAFRAELSKV